MNNEQPVGKVHSYFSSIAVYSNPKIIAIAFLGFVSGLPLSLTASTLSTWLTEAGVSKAAIGLFAAIGTPYVLKFLWAPLVDQLHLPFLTKKFGRRRSWIIFSEIALVISLILLGLSNPVENPWNTAFFALLVAISSATQDIVIDAYRVEILEEDQQGAGAAAVVFGYRMGMLVAGAGALVLAHYYGWLITYLLMACLVPIGAITVLIMGGPSVKLAKEKEGLTEWLNRAVVEPFGDFIRRPGWLTILLFIALYKLGDAFAGVMTNPFLIDINFTKVEIAAIVKTYGVFALLAGAFVGGSMVHKIGIIKSLWVAGILQMVSNLMFVWQAYVGNDNTILLLTISVENFCSGLGAASGIAFLSALCNRQYTATQYALFSAIAAIGRIWLSTPSGYVVEWLGWADFFIFSALVSIPGLIFLIFAARYWRQHET